MHWQANPSVLQYLFTHIICLPDTPFNPTYSKLMQWMVQSLRMMQQHLHIFTCSLHCCRMPNRAGCGGRVPLSAI